MIERNLVEIRTTVACTMVELGVHLDSWINKVGYTVVVTEDDKEILIPVLKLKMRKDKNVASFEFGQLSETGVKYAFEDKDTYLSLTFIGEERDYTYGDMKFFLPVTPNSFVTVKPLQHKPWNI